ncbi:hypothetical protein ACW9HQ_37065, partial [Nocardia gipuzkoensis]
APAVVGAAAVVVVGAGVVVGGVVVVEAGTAAELVTGAAAFVVGLGAPVDCACPCGVEPELSEPDFDSDIAPRPANTMASAINTIASARSGGPPEGGFGLLT